MRTIPSLYDGRTLLVTGFMEVEPGLWKRTYEEVSAEGIVLEDGTYRGTV